MVAGAVVKIVASIILIGIPEIGIYGTPIGTFLCYMTTTVINFFFLAKYVDLRPSFINMFMKPLVASVLCCFGAYGGYELMSLAVDTTGRMGNLIATFGGIVVAGLIYLVLVLLFKMIGEDEVKMLPKGNKIYALLKKVKLMK